MFAARQTKRILILWALLSLSGFGLLRAAAAQELIESFDSAIELFESGEVMVEETIIVNAEGQQIRRGIFRDFPRFRVDAQRKRQKVLLDVQSVLRDGRPEPFSTSRISGGTRIRIGDENVMLESGTHTYVIRYLTDRQVRFFDSHDELLWNVTGNDWSFPIVRASATITIPESGRIEKTVVYTGASGSREKNAVATISDPANEARFQTTSSLAPGEGLTVGIAFPKQVVGEADKGQQFAWFIRDYLGALILAGGTLIVGLYYFSVWWRTGRDPAAGVLVPRWRVSGDLSPALVAYIEERNNGSQRMISAAILSLAVKGLVRLHDVPDCMKIVPTSRLLGQGAIALPAGEAALTRSIASRPEGLTMDSGHGSEVSAAVTAFHRAMRQEHRQVYYRRNTGWIVLGVLLSLAVIFGSFLAGGVPVDLLPIGLPIVFAVVVLSMALSRIFQPGRSSPIGRRILNLVLTAFVVFTIIAGSAGAFLELAAQIDLDWSFIALGVLLLINLLFITIMGAPTPLGRKKMDEIAGLKTYIEMAEADRMNLRGAPRMSPTHYETLLPYAVALDLEKPWTRHFQAWLATASAAAGGAYLAQHSGPGWYTGTEGVSNWADAMDGVGSRMNEAVSASMPAPSSSSSGFSGGGGSSGSGGGGGGGGGW